MNTIVHASSPWWEVVKHNRRFQLWWKGPPDENPQAELNTAGVPITLNGNNRAVLTKAQAIEATVTLNLEPHWGVPGATKFKNSLTAAYSRQRETQS